MPKVLVALAVEQCSASSTHTLGISLQFSCQWIRCLLVSISICTHMHLHTDTREHNLKQINSVYEPTEESRHTVCSLTEYCFSHQKKDGIQEVLFTNDHHINNSTSLKDRVQLDTDYGLQLSPVQVQDDGRTFSCHLRVNPLKVWKTSTTVKVFGEFSLGSLRHPNVNALAMLFHGEEATT